MPPFKLIGNLEEAYPTDYGSTNEGSAYEKQKIGIRHGDNPFPTRGRALPSFKLPP
jgi:hypothetical protein